MKLFFASAYADRAQRWREHLTLAPLAEGLPRHGYYLCLDGPRLRLCYGADSDGVCLNPDQLARRTDPRTALARACRTSPRDRPLVVDATAGLGTDALTLASLGCEVVAYERVPALWALLDDYLVSEAVTNVTLHCADARRCLDPTVGQQPCCDTLYLDPMFPSRRKTALPNKTMQYVRAVVELHAPPPQPLAAESDVELLRSCARHRVVLKRRLKDPVVTEPDWQIKGRTVRFDVYRGRG